MHGQRGSSAYGGGGVRAAACAVLAEVLGEGARSAGSGVAGSLAVWAAAGPAEAAEVSRAMLGAAEPVVADCWRRGWQPADLVRACARLQSDRAERAREAPMLLDVVAAEARRHDQVRLDARWAAQLADAGARAWWGDDGFYLTGLIARRAGAAPVTAGAVAPSVTALAEVVRPWLGAVCRLRWLPDLALIGPVPGWGGAPAGAAGGAAPDPADLRQLHRIRALLAKAESTTFEGEADALTAKAQQLMARHSITAALLDDAGARAGQGSGGPASRRVGIDDPYEGPKSLLLGEVARANRCRTAWSRNLGFVTLVGFEPDVEAVELLYTSLLVQATAAMTRAGSRQGACGASRTRSFRRSFLIAYACRVGARLDEAARAATEEAAAGSAAGGGGDAGPCALTADERARLLPVLAGREKAVDRETARLFPELVSQRVRCSDAEGWAHGTAAADQAVLRAPRSALGGGGS